MEYNNGWFNNNATTENQSVGLDLTLRIGQPDNKVDQQQESRLQICNVNLMQYESINVEQNNYLRQKQVYNVSSKQFNYQNQTNLVFVNQKQANYVNQQPWMNFSSTLTPITSNNLMTTTRVMPNNSTQLFDQFPSFIPQPMSRVRTCNVCQTTTTPMWRRGPNGPHTLCNACGLRHARIVKREN